MKKINIFFISTKDFENSGTSLTVSEPLGNHVEIVPPNSTGSLFYNYKKKKV